MFGHVSGPARNYSYDTKAPILNAERVVDQMLKAHRYRNNLCELEHARRDAVNAVLREQCSELLSLTEQELSITETIDNMLAAIKARRITERKKVGASDEQQSKLKAERTTLKGIRKRIKELKATLWTRVDVVARLDQIEAQNRGDCKAARKACGLYWGSYLHQEQSCSSFRKGRPPRFMRWKGDGTLAVQIQGGMDFETAMNCEDTRLRIERVPESAWTAPKRGDRRRAARTRVWFRIGSEENGSPIWTILPLLFHRPLPEGSYIKWARLCHRRVATESQWSLVLSIENANGFEKPNRATEGRVGVDVGYRMVDGDLRVATFFGSDEKMQRLVLPGRMVSGWRKVDDLQAIRDKNFNEIKELMATWRDEQCDKLPEWLRERWQYLRQWRSPAKLTSVVLKWREERFEGDVWAYKACEAWRKQDKHLYLWQEHQRQKLIRRRLDIYRNFVARLREQYKTAVVEDINWREMLSLTPVDQEDDTPATARYYAKCAAVGTLIRVIEENMDVERKDPQNTTQRCWNCGTLANFDARTELSHHCTICDRDWDQDENAARNLVKEEPKEVTV